MLYPDVIITIDAIVLILALLLIGVATFALTRQRSSLRWRRNALRYGGALSALLALALVLGGGGDLATLLTTPTNTNVSHLAPTPANNTVVYTANNWQNTGTAGDTLVGVSARDGSTRWTRRLSAPVSQLLQPQSNLTLALTYTLPYDASVYALRNSNGAILWRVSNLNFFVLNNTHAIAADSSRLSLITFTRQASGQTLEPPLPTVVAHDLLSGALLWSHPLPNAYIPTISDHPLLMGDGLVVMDYEPENPVTGGIDATNDVLALDAATGARRWVASLNTMRAEKPFIEQVFISGGVVAISSAANGVESVSALRERDGTLLWTLPTDALTGITDTRIYAITSDTQAVYLLLNSPDSLWPKDAQGSMLAPPYTLAALSASDGTRRWSTTTGHHLDMMAFSAPGGALLFGSADSEAIATSSYTTTLSAYDASSGRILWSQATPPNGPAVMPIFAPQSVTGSVYLQTVRSDPSFLTRLTCPVTCASETWLSAVNIRTGAVWWRMRTGFAFPPPHPFLVG